MKGVSKVIIALLVILLFLGYSKLYAQWHLDMETGLVFSGYNDVSIPKSIGTLISLSEDLKTDPTIFFRAKLHYAISDKHKLAILVAPLRVRASGQIDRLVRFEGEEFEANTQLKSVYRFDSYRVTYRYDFYKSANLQAGLGLTGKIRDAAISLEDGDNKAEKTNTGFVPLINFKVQWMLAKDFNLLLDGDALAAPQGRAEDVLFAMQYQLNKNVGLKLGYRVLEGGADIEEVYNFALLHYIVIGAILAF